MSVTVDSNGVTLTGDEFGVNWARKQLAAAPSTAVKMQFVYRSHMTGGTSYLNRGTTGWDSCGFFGLGFDNTIFEFSGNTITPSGFFGLCTKTLPTDGSSYYPNEKVYSYYSGGAGYIRACPWAGYPFRWQYIDFWDGKGASLATTDRISSATNLSELVSFPYGTTEGAMATHMWEVWGSTVDNSVYCRMVKDLTSMAEGDAMFAALDGKSEGTSPGQYLQHTIHGDTTSNWRNADGTMNFPRWLKMKFVFPEYTMNLDYFKVRYLDVNDVVI